MEISSTVTVIGDPVVGNTLAAVPNISYQWYSGGVAIPGATSKDYTVQAVDVGKIISVTMNESDQLSASMPVPVVA